jgi:4-alpha-glucanotransferase
MSTDAWGITSGYEDAEEVWHDTPAETSAAILAAMGVAADGPDLLNENAVRVVHAGAETAWSVPGDLVLEDGTSLKISRKLPRDLPLGYHNFQPADEQRGPTRLIVSPGQCPLPPRERNWGWAVQLYATRSRDSWGMGDLADLRRLSAWAAGLRATMLLVNPLGSASPLLPQQASPYYPISRRFRNPLYLRVEEVPGAAVLGPELERFAAQGKALNAQSRIDRDQVFKLKQAALEHIFASFSGDAAFDRYCVEQGSQLLEFATFCTLSEKLGGDWRSWASGYRSPNGSSVRQFVEDNKARVRYHQWLQWNLDEQLRAASADLPLMHDLPIGVDPGGADAWAWQEVLAQGVSVGAPPDVYNTQGQDWGLPPFVPYKLRAAGYEPLVQTFRAALRHAGALRIDHVMGLFRLFWIPWGFGPKRGAFVRYRPDETLAILALEAHRAGAYVVGEDLGTVEDGVREQLLAHSILSYRLLWFEEEPPESYPRMAMVAATTHDLPTIAGLWSGTDLADQHRLDLKPSDEAVQEMRDRLATMTGLAGDEPVETVIERAYSLLAEAPSMVVSATLEDALGLEARTNMPGTVDQWPNWSVALPGGIEALEQAPLAQSIAKALRGTPRARTRPQSRSTT